MTVIFFILAIVAMLCSIFAWYNTKLIMEDLDEIKDHLGIERKQYKSFIDNDLDND